MIDRIKASLADQNIAWYPYRTIAVYQILEKLLTGRRRALLDLAWGDPILDLGCADGVNALFLEGLGCQVWAADNPATIRNHGKGFHALREALDASVPFHTVDLDSRFSLPLQTFGLTIFLGVLYHLKNPYYALETLARHTRYCLLSTRIAEYTPQGTQMSEEALAYLLAPGEANNDATNYWIFSEPALRLVLERTGWKVCDFMTIGASHSEPARGDRDKRAFCLLESRHVPLYSLQLGDGWHSLEEDRFRWTARSFSIELECSPLFTPTQLNFTFRNMRPNAVTLSAQVNGSGRQTETFGGAAVHAFAIRLKTDSEPASAIKIEFELDRAATSTNGDQRELGVAVLFRDSEMDQPDLLLPFFVE